MFTIIMRTLPPFPQFGIWNISTHCRQATGVMDFDVSGIEFELSGVSWDESML